MSNNKKPKQANKKFGVSLPAEIVAEIDCQAATWHTDRSKALVRIWQELKTLRRQLELEQTQ